MRILITGGAGFIGSHLADALLDLGHEVLAIDNLETGKRENLPEEVRFRLLDVSNGFQFTAGSFRPEVVVHAAASYRDPADWLRDSRTNVQGTVRVLQDSVKLRVERFVYLQTSLCYGPPREQAITLDHPINPQNSYAITKTAAERFVMMSGLDWVSFRLANCYGPRNLSGPVPTFYKKLANGESCTVVDTRRDFVYVDDLVDYLLDAVLQGKGKGIYHVSSGRDYSIKELYDQVLFNIDPLATEYIAPEMRERNPDDVESILLDNSRTLEEFGYTPGVSLLEGVRRTVKWYKEHGVGTTYTHLRGY
jgi:UDP-glucose 4-epimerase